MSSFLENVFKGDSSSATKKPVDQAKVDNAMKMLKKNLGRDPKPEEVADYLAKMVDQDRVDQTVNDLKSQLGRDPTAQEVADKLEENDAAVFGDDAPAWFNEALAESNSPEIGEDVADFIKEAIEQDKADGIW